MEDEEGGKEGGQRGDVKGRHPPIHVASFASGQSMRPFNSVNRRKKLRGMTEHGAHQNIINPAPSSAGKLIGNAGPASGAPPSLVKLGGWYVSVSLHDLWDCEERWGEVLCLFQTTL